MTDSRAPRSIHPMMRARRLTPQADNSELRLHWSPAYTIRSEPDITQCSPEVSRIYPSASGGNHQAFTFTPHVMPPSAAPRAGSRNITACASRRQALQWPQGGDPHRSASVILLGYRVKEITLAARSIKILPQLQQHGLNQRPQRLRNPVPPETRNTANPFTKVTSGQVLRRTGRTT